jgi:hypothetical protein
MIGQVTKPAMTDVKYRYYYLFIVSEPAKVSVHVLTDDQICNLTNAIFFWAVLPETAKRPLEEMNSLFTNAPYFIPSMKKEDYMTHEIDQRVEAVERKLSVVSHIEHKV